MAVARRIHQHETEPDVGHTLDYRFLEWWFYWRARGEAAASDEERLALTWLAEDALRAVLRNEPPVTDACDGA